MRRTFCIAAALAAAVVGRPAAAQQEETTVALPALTLNFSMSYIADAMGYWRDAGLNVKIVDIVGVGAMNAVIAGSVDFSNGSVTSFLRANIRGQKLMALGPVIDGVQVELVLSKAAAQAAGVTPDMPIEKRAAALKGKRLAVDSPNTIPHAFLRYVVRKGGIDPERDVTVAMMQPAPMLAALKGGSIDGFSNAPPFGLVPVQDGTAIMIASGPRGDLPELLPMHNTVVLTRPEVCEKRPTVCRKLMQGYVKAVAYLHDKPKEATAVLQKKLADMDPGVFATSFENTRRWTPRSMQLTEIGFANAQNFMVVGGMLKPEEKLSSFKELYTDSFAK